MIKTTDFTSCANEERSCAEMRNFYKVNRKLNLNIAHRSECFYELAGLSDGATFAPSPERNERVFENVNSLLWPSVDVFLFIKHGGFHVLVYGEVVLDSNY